MCTVIVKGSRTRICFECPYFRNIRQKDGRITAECMARTPKEYADPNTKDKCPIT